MKNASRKLLPFRPLGKSRGFSLVELMVASTIGLILLGGVGYVYLGSQQTFRTQDDFSRIQENVRYALDQVGVDVRMAGYAGCLNLASIDPANPTAAPAIGVIANSPPTVGLEEAMRGYDGATWTAPGTEPANWISDTGVFVITRASEGGVNLTGNTTPTNANMQIAGNPNNFVDGEALLVANCLTADLFRATSVSNSGGKVTIAHSESSNTANFTDNTYGDEAEMFRMISNTYFIGTNTVGVPALYRRPLDGDAEEMVDNVENIVMRFGVDTDNDFVVNNYAEAGDVTNWRQVMTARISMVFRSNSTNIATEVQPCVVENISCPPPTNTADRRLRQVATATIGLRNRLP